MSPKRPFLHPRYSIAVLCLLTILGTPARGQTLDPVENDSATRVEAPSPVFDNLSLGGHTMFANPRYVDSELSGNVRFRNLLDLGGFVGIVPHAFGHGGSHYGEVKGTLRLFTRGAFSVGPAFERVTTSNAADFTKFGMSGNALFGSVFLDWEVFPVTTRGSGGGGTWYTIPLPGPWKLDGFWNYEGQGTSVGKVNLHYQLLPRLDVMVEYFHNGFLKGAEQDRVGIGIGYKFK
jgi:hypothetical protein